MTADWKWRWKVHRYDACGVERPVDPGPEAAGLIVVVNASTESIPVRLADLGRAFPDARTALVTRTWPDVRHQVEEKAAFRAETTVAGLTARAGNFRAVEV